MSKGIRQTLTALLLAMAFALEGTASASGPGDKTTAGPIPIMVRTVTDEIVYGDLLSFSLDDGVLLRSADGRQRRIPIADVVRLDAQAAAAGDKTPHPQDWAFTLTDGGLLYGRIAGARETAVVVETLDLGAVALPLDSFRHLESPRSLRPAYEQSAAWLSRTEFLETQSSSSGTPAAASDEDAVLLINGDVLAGFISAVDQDGVTIDSAWGEAKVPLRRIVAVRTAAPPPPPLGSAQSSSPVPPYVIVTFRNSGRLSMADFTWSKRVAEARLRDGQSVQIEAERVVRVEVVGGRWEWLSSNQPISHQHTPMLSLSFDHAINRNVLGGPIRVAGETFEQGIGVHSRSELKYELKGAYQAFVTYFGIDDDSGRYADVSVRVLVDGKPMFEQTNVRRGKLHGPVRLDVTGARLLELVVDFGENGDVQDRFNWVEPALIR